MDVAFKTSNYEINWCGCAMVPRFHTGEGLESALPNRDNGSSSVSPLTFPNPNMLFVSRDENESPFLYDTTNQDTLDVSGTYESSLRLFDRDGMSTPLYPSTHNSFAPEQSGFTEIKEERPPVAVMSLQNETSQIETEYEAAPSMYSFANDNNPKTSVVGPNINALATQSEVPTPISIKRPFVGVPSTDKPSVFCSNSGSNAKLDDFFPLPPHPIQSDEDSNPFGLMQEFQHMDESNFETCDSSERYQTTPFSMKSESLYGDALDPQYFNNALPTFSNRSYNPSMILCSQGAKSPQPADNTAPSPAVDTYNQDISESSIVMCRLFNYLRKRLIEEKISLPDQIQNVFKIDSGNPSFTSAQEATMLSWLIDNEPKIFLDIPDGLISAAYKQKQKKLKVAMFVREIFRASIQDAAQSAKTPCPAKL